MDFTTSIRRWLPAAGSGSRNCAMPWRLKPHLPWMLWAVLIIAVSSLPGDRFPELLPLWQWDTIAHAAEYAVLGILLIHGFRPAAAPRPLISGLLIVVAITLFAGADELHQSFIPLRTVAWQDFVADAAGGFTGVMAGTILARHRRCR